MIISRVKSVKFSRVMKFESIEDLIGNTPLVRVNKLCRHFPVNVWAKCEYFNPGGSIKDRIAKSMLDSAVAQNKTFSTIIEPSSGNTAIGLALLSAIRGFECIITMPEKCSKEKEIVLQALGATIFRTRTEEPSESPYSHIGIAFRMKEMLQGAFIPDQYSNEANPQHHYDFTAEEILRDLDGKIDMFVASPGTGGTLTGVARKLKEVNPNCIVVAADPIGSILGGGDLVAPYKVEGIGYDFFPKVFDPSLVDIFVKVSDDDCFWTARDLIRSEGFLVGGSSGANFFAALQNLHRLKEGSNCVVVFPDGVRNYLFKFVSNEWIAENGFLKFDDSLKLSDIPIDPKFILQEFSGNESCQEVSEILLRKNLRFGCVASSTSDFEVFSLNEALISGDLVKDLRKSKCSFVNPETPVNQILSRLPVWTELRDQKIFLNRDFLVSLKHLLRQQSKPQLAN